MTINDSQLHRIRTLDFDAVDAVDAVVVVVSVLLVLLVLLLSLGDDSSPNTSSSLNAGVLESRVVPSVSLLSPLLSLSIAVTLPRCIICTRSPVTSGLRKSSSSPSIIRIKAE